MIMSCQLQLINALCTCARTEPTGWARVASSQTLADCFCGGALLQPMLIIVATADQGFAGPPAGRGAGGVWQGALPSHCRARCAGPPAPCRSSCRSGQSDQTCSPLQTWQVKQTGQYSSTSTTPPTQSLELTASRCDGLCCHWRFCTFSSGVSDMRLVEGLTWSGPPPAHGPAGCRPLPMTGCPSQRCQSSF